jgi:hypothetical protein
MFHSLNIEESSLRGGQIQSEARFSKTCALAQCSFRLLAHFCLFQSPLCPDMVEQGTNKQARRDDRQK